MDTVTDMDMLMVTHMEVMDMEDRVSPGTIFLKATLPTFGFPCFKVLKWEETALVRIYWQIFVPHLAPFLSSRAEHASRGKPSSEDGEKEAGALRMRRVGSAEPQDGPGRPRNAEEEKAGSGENQGFIRLGKSHSCDWLEIALWVMAGVWEIRGLYMNGSLWEM